MAWESVRPLLRLFTGTLQVTRGTLPERSAYIGPDPDRLLLFSRVQDNFLAWGLEHAQSVEALNSFGLDRAFLRRRLGQLSGGERMRVGLALAFAGEYEVKLAAMRVRQTR